MNTFWLSVGLSWWQTSSYFCYNCHKSHSFSKHTEKLGHHLQVQIYTCGSQQLILFQLAFCNISIAAAVIARMVTAISCWSQRVATTQRWCQGWLYCQTSQGFFWPLAFLITLSRALWRALLFPCSFCSNLDCREIIVVFSANFCLLIFIFPWLELVQNCPFVSHLWLAQHVQIPLWT